MDLGSGRTLEKTSESIGLAGGASPSNTGITVDKSVEFSYEELANATDEFSLANKIGQGGFGAVYYAELRGEVCCFDIILHHHRIKSAIRDFFLILGTKTEWKLVIQVRY